MPFSARLRAAIRKAGLTQPEAAAKIGCSTGSITYWLAGGQPRLAMYERICAVFPEVREPAQEPVAS
jgi:transcriptional regulator with XRE-family HTH domain